jgi:hypothetical protein
MGMLMYRRQVEGLAIDVYAISSEMNRPVEEVLNDEPIAARFAHILEKSKADKSVVIEDLNNCIRLLTGLIDNKKLPEQFYDTLSNPWPFIGRGRKDLVGR